MAKAKKTKFVARLGDGGILVGYDEVGIDADGVEVPDRDLAPGRYRWTGETFVPCAPPESLAGLVGKPTALRAIVLGFEALDRGEPLPDETRAWIAEQRGTVDMKRSFDGGEA